LTIEQKIKALELRLRAIYLATDREEDMWNWIDAATVRVGLSDYETGKRGRTNRHNGSRR